LCPKVPKFERFSPSKNDNQLIFVIYARLIDYFREMRNFRIFKELKIASGMNFREICVLCRFRLCKKTKNKKPSSTERPRRFLSTSESDPAVTQPEARTQHSEYTNTHTVTQQSTAEQWALWRSLQ
jgi:hypothetical protein